MKIRPSILYLLLTFLFTIPAVFSFLYFNFFTFHDETQIVNMYEFFKTIDLGQFPPRWGLDFHFNYGSPFLQFYYQTPYYLGYIFHLAGLNLVSIFKIILILGFFIGASGMYLLGLQFTTPLWSFIAAVLYTYTPYRAVTSFVRGSLGESLALALFPWIFLFSLRLYKNPNLKKAIIAGIFWALLILTHQLATIFFLPFIFLIGLIYAFYNRRLIPYLFVSIFTSFGLSAYYLLPTIFEQKFIQTGGPFNFYDHFPFLRQLIIPSWGYRASIWGPDDGLSFQLGLVPLFVLFISFVAGYSILRSKTKKTLKFTYFYLLLSFLGTIFLMNIRSSFIWEALNFAQLVQFPWRLLLLTTFLIPVIFIYISKFIPQNLSRPLFFLLLFASPIFTISYFQPGETYDRPDEYYLHRFLPNVATEDQATVSAEYLTHTEDYVSLPVDAVRPKNLPAAKLTSANESTKIFIKNDYPFNSEYQIETEEDDVLTFHTFYFPGWTVKLGEQLIETGLNENGAITIPVSQGQYTLTISYTKTPIRQFSDYLSLLTLLGLLFILFKHHSHHQGNQSKS